MLDLYTNMLIIIIMLNTIIALRKCNWYSWIAAIEANIFIIIALSLLQQDTIWIEYSILLCILSSIIPYFLSNNQS